VFFLNRFNIRSQSYLFVNTYFEKIFKIRKLLFFYDIEIKLLV
jgi:hypothetical protein